jgi:flagellar protein FliS
MRRGGGLGAYRTVEVTTADPGRLVLLLFDGAIRFLHAAGTALDRGHTAEFARALSRAHAIIGALSASLDHDVGGELAANLARLYSFMLLHLTQGLLAKSRRHVDEALHLLQTLREGFEGALGLQGHARA